MNPQALETLASWIKKPLSSGRRRISTPSEAILIGLSSSHSSDLRITVMGESAGGSSIMHHITAKGGTTTPVFKQAILQSPAFFPQLNPHSITLTDRFSQIQLNLQFDNFVNQSGCSPGSTALHCLRNLDTGILQNANIYEIKQAPWGEFQYGPAIDGVYVTDMPGKELLLNGSLPNITLMLGHNRSRDYHLS